ncbi:hypothetical protein WJX73_003545 [Symbiochloris irregularis]|uniref:DUS-like FMN-binding domain-containing protein n=1 Tax=Symbiochloris irregularis TaxID=706552 RepID=A0AAW1P343_9CHLO
MNASSSYQPQLLSVAPMMDWTDIHYRQLARLISKHTWLYTEMVVDNALIHNPNRDRWLWYPPEQHPIVCQLGGSNPALLAKAAKIVAEYGYDEINLNCGLGVDDADSYEELCNFIATVSSQSSVSHFILHARKCLLSGLSPAENRTIPPLRWGWVYALSRDFPHLHFSLNGGVELCRTAQSAIEHAPPNAGRIHGVMIGRGAYNMPWPSLGSADHTIFGMPAEVAPTRRQVLEKYIGYAESVIGRFGTKSDGSPVPTMRSTVKPLLALFHGEKGCKAWKRSLDASMLAGGMDVAAVIQSAMRAVPDEVLDAPPCPPSSLPIAFATGELPPPVSLQDNGVCSSACTTLSLSLQLSGPRLGAAKQQAGNAWEHMSMRAQIIARVGEQREVGVLRFWSWQHFFL